LSSAWLIRRFIDPEGRFLFVDPATYTHSPGELRFDMYEGEYGHEGERCTFETLLARFGLADPALQRVGEVVHDIDCKESRYGHPEASGVATMVLGIAATHPRDEDRHRAHLLRRFLRRPAASEPEGARTPAASVWRGRRRPRPRRGIGEGWPGNRMRRARPAAGERLITPPARRTSATR
jgi:hypothetical protein